jgi:23S rRNA pseudouridine1911/1915/1917 synthase
MPATAEKRRYHTDAPGERLDRWLAAQNKDFSRSRIKQLIAAGHVSVAGRTINDPAHKLKDGQAVELALPAVKPTHLTAQDMELDVVFEDEHLIVVNKPAGMVVHPAAGNPDRTLVNALLAHCGESLLGIGGELRPGIVHRLDKDTSGLLVAAKTAAAHAHLAAQFAEHSIMRAYDALVWGVPSPPQGVIKSRIGRSTHDRKKMAVRTAGGKHAETHYDTLESFGAAAWVRCKLLTGRTHQIRVHMTSRGHPLIGDQTYGAAKSTKGLDKQAISAMRAFKRQALHARLLGFIHPATKRKLRFEREPPKDFLKLATKMRAAV